MQDDELPRTPDPAGAGVDRALAAWTPLAPPDDFADRVLAARGASPRGPSWRRRVAAAGGIAAIAAAAVLAVVLRPSPRATSGALTATRRTTQALGDRGIAVVEADTELTWRVDDRGAADLVQRTGNTFYRVERGEPFVVHTPAGDVRVTGTCFRIEVEPMNPTQKMLLAGVAGAAVASTVLVTVYEGHVIAETRSAKTELAPGTSARLGPADSTVVGAATATPGDDAHATREQLLQRSREQQAQLAALRARIAALEKVAPAGPVEGQNPLDDPEPGRAWHDPSPERLAAWVADCHVRTDEPGLDRFTPSTTPSKDLGLEPGEIDGYNAAMTEMARRWKDLVRGLYIEATGDTAGADTLSSLAMRREIEEKSPRGEHNLILQRLAQERAGLAAPPADPSQASPLERLMRAFVQLGDQSEAALAKRIGAQRAHAVRGDAWGDRSQFTGCPG